MRACADVFALMQTQGLLAISKIWSAVEPFLASTLSHCLRSPATGLCCTDNLKTTMWYSWFGQLQRTLSYLHLVIMRLHILKRWLFTVGFYLLQWYLLGATILRRANISSWRTRSTIRLFQYIEEPTVHACPCRSKNLWWVMLSTFNKVTEYLQIVFFWKKWILRLTKGCTSRATKKIHQRKTQFSMASWPTQTWNKTTTRRILTHSFLPTPRSWLAQVKQ